MKTRYAPDLDPDLAGY